MARSKDLNDPDVRKARLTALRNLKMARSPQAYVRGSTAKFYEWLGSAEALKLPQGPPIWICGDCHTGNLGPTGSAKGRIEVQIRDLDQTVIGNPAHDLIRLALSLASAARGSDLPGVLTARMIEHLIDGYEHAFDSKDETSRVEPPETVRGALLFATKRKWTHLARERIADTKPGIPMGKTFWPLAESERAALTILFSDEKTRRLVTALSSRDDDAGVELLDAAYWVKGCSSLGLLRYAALVQVGGKAGEVCLVDIKEATKALAPRAEGVTMPRDNAERVVQGAWHLSPNLGNRMAALRLNEASVFVRELLPQDLKLNISHLDPGNATRLARYLAGVVGTAHARQMDEDLRLGWRKQLAAGRSKTLDAPSWLWRAVVDLMSLHEAAYLEHCRKYALTHAA